MAETNIASTSAANVDLVEITPGTIDDDDVDEDFPPLRRRAARLFRPIPPPPPPFWASTQQANGLGDRERSWTPDQEWERNLTTIEPAALDLTRPPSAPSLRPTPGVGIAAASPRGDDAQIDSATALARLDSLSQLENDITSSSLMVDAQQAAMAVSATIEAFRERNSLMCSNAREQARRLEQRIQALTAVDTRVDELERRFRTVEEELQVLQRGTTTGLSDEDLSFRLRRVALPGLRHIVSVLDSFKDELDNQATATPPEPAEDASRSEREEGDARITGEDPGERVLSDLFETSPPHRFLIHKIRALNGRQRCIVDLFMSMRYRLYAEERQGTLPMVQISEWSSVESLERDISSLDEDVQQYTESCPNLEGEAIARREVDCGTIEAMQRRVKRCLDRLETGTLGEPLAA